jgi:hypothetical protein
MAADNLFSATGRLVVHLIVTGGAALGEKAGRRRVAVLSEPTGRGQPPPIPGLHATTERRLDL